MCARLLACPLCSQPGFLTLDALRAGLVSVATRPLVCPVCNEILLGIDKLTIHLFGHTINPNNTNNLTEHPKVVDVVSCNNAQRTVQDREIIPLQAWNILRAQTIESDKLEDRNIECRIRAIHKIPVIPLRKEEYSRDTINCHDNVAIANPQAHLRSQDVTSKATDQMMFVQNLSQLQRICASNLTQPEQNLRQDMSVVQQSHQDTIVDTSRKTCDGSEIKFESQQSSQKQALSESERTNGITQYNCDNDVSRQLNTQNTANVERVNTSQFQHTWIENVPCQICTQSSLPSTNSSTVLCENHPVFLDTSTIIAPIIKESQFSTIPPISCVTTSTIKSSYKLQENQKDVENLKNSTTEKEEDTINQQQNLDRIKVLPQLKALRVIATKGKTERCDICGFHFADRNILILHKQLVHTIDEKDFNDQPENLLKNYPCHLCSKIFKMRGSLMVHMRVAHIGFNLGSLPKDGELVSNPGENGYSCPTCGKIFKKEQHVTQHLKTHEGKQWECDVCSKMFTTKYFLKKHKRLHSGEMPYKCNICDKTFTFQQSYHKHRLYHKDDKPHACTTCGRSFKELSTLHNHERIHTGEKPFACETCGKCFRQRVSYLVHRRIHTGAMPYKCTACGKSFRYKVSQRTHKCPAQPPGTVVCQSGDLVERLIRVSQIRDVDTNLCNVTKESNVVTDQCVSDVVTDKNNKFILIVNSQGRHVLTQQRSNGENTSAVNKEDDNFTKFDKINEEFIKDLWGHDIPSGTTLKESMEVTAKEHARNDKSKVQNTNDFFSMVMSPMENEVPSPSTELEHLRLSSPRNETNLSEMNESFRQSPNNFEGDVDDINAQVSYREGNDIGGSLQTINEESLKQLLYDTNAR